MLKGLKVAFGLLKHEINGYREAYLVAREWANTYPGIDPSDFKALEDQAWSDIEKDMGDACKEFCIPPSQRN